MVASKPKLPPPCPDASGFALAASPGLVSPGTQVLPVGTVAWKACQFTTGTAVTLSPRDTIGTKLWPCLRFSGSLYVIVRITLLEL